MAVSTISSRKFCTRKPHMPILYFIKWYFFFTKKKENIIEKNFKLYKLILYVYVFIIDHFYLFLIIIIIIIVFEF